MLTFKKKKKERSTKDGFLSTHEQVGVQPKTEGSFVESMGFSCTDFLKLSPLSPQLRKMAELGREPICVKIHRLLPGPESLGDDWVLLASVAFLRNCNLVLLILQYLNTFVSCIVLSCFLFVFYRSVILTHWQK